jgi:hypothetical protein
MSRNQIVGNSGNTAEVDSDGSVLTKLSGSNVIQPIDQQARLIVTQAAQSGTLIALSSVNSQSTWTPVPDGMTEFMNNLITDANVSNVVINVAWSEDGTNISGKTNNSITSIQATYKSSASWFPVGGAFYKVEIVNGDAAAHTCSANIKFRP